MKPIAEKDCQDIPTDPIIFPDMPAVDGLVFRSITDEKDAARLYAVHAGRIDRDQVNPSSHFEDMPSLDDLHDELSQAVAAGEQDQWFVAQVCERVVGYSQLTSWHEEDDVWVYFIGGWVLPAWRGKGIGTAMLHWGEEMARHSAATLHPGERFEFAANASSTEHDAAALLRNKGYYIAFTTLEMHFDISTALPPAPPLPAGIEVRPVLPEHYSQITSGIIDCYYNAFPGNRYRTTFDRVAYYSAEWLKPKYDPKLWYVAWDGDEVAGQVMMVIQNGQVHLSQVSIRPAWRRRGLARALLIRALWDMRDRGERMIWTDTFAEYQTRAVDLYRSLGFYVTKEFPRYRKPAG